MATSKNLVKVGRIISRIIGSVYCVVAAFMLAYAVICFTGPSSDLTRSLAHGLTMGNGCYGLNAQFLSMNSVTAGATYVVCALLNVLLALSFCNVCRCLKIAENETPFQLKVQRMISQVAYFMLAGFIVANIGNFVLVQLAHQGGFGVSVDIGLDRLIFGILVLCLSLVFKRGIELESEVEGLI